MTWHGLRRVAHAASRLAWAKLRGAVRIMIAVPGNFAHPTLIAIMESIHWSGACSDHVEKPNASWPGVSRPHTPCFQLGVSKTWVPGTRPSMTTRDRGSTRAESALGGATLNGMRRKRHAGSLSRAYLRYCRLMVAPLRLRDSSKPTCVPCTSRTTPFAFCSRADFPPPATAIPAETTE
jgi:hypothetical protein